MWRTEGGEDPLGQMVASAMQEKSATKFPVKQTYNSAQTEFLHAIFSVWKCMDPAVSAVPAQQGAETEGSGTTLFLMVGCLLVPTMLAHLQLRSTAHLQPSGLRAQGREVIPTQPSVSGTWTSDTTASGKEGPQGSPAHGRRNIL